MTQILVFGDSIAYGAWDSEGGGWVERLRKFLAERTAADSSLQYLLYNLSVSGDTTEWLLERFESEAHQRLDIVREEEEDEEIMFIFAIGINDTKIAHSNGKTLVSVEQFKKNIRRIVTAAKKHSDKIIFVGLTPVHEATLQQFTMPFDYSYKNGQIQGFNSIIKAVCTKEKTHFIEVYDDFTKRGYEKLLADGLHPNSDGHKKIFEIVKSFLVDRKML